MKSFSFFFVFILLFTGVAINAQSPDGRISNFANSTIGKGVGGINNAYFLTGFDFQGYNESYPKLETMTQAEVNAVVNGTNVQKAPSSYGIVRRSARVVRTF